MTSTMHSGKASVSLPTDTQILIEREFDAPVELVYRAYTEPDLIRRWWSGQRGEVTDVQIDLRVGGRWRYVMIANEGFEVAFHGEFREIVPNARIVATEVFEGAPAADEYPAGADEGAAVTTTTFSEVGGRTLLTQAVECGTREVRDAIIGSGMEEGMQESFDALEGVARSLG